MKLPSALSVGSLLLALLLSVNVFAGSLPREQISADAKWLVHLDVEALLQTQLGGYVARELLDPKLNKAAADLSRQFGLDLDWRKIRSLTAYGTDLKAPGQHDGVLLVRSDLDVAASLDAVLDKFAGAGAGDSVPLRKLQSEPYPLYAAHGSVFGAVLAKGLLVVAHSQADVEKAAEIIKGKGASLKVRQLPEQAQDLAGFLTVGVTDVAAAGAKLPPQARVLKDATGVCLVAGERADKVFVNAALDAKDSTVAGQLQQALQGVLAVARLSDLDNKDLKDLADSATIGGKDKTVTLDLQMTVTAVLDKLGKVQKKKHG